MYFAKEEAQIFENQLMTFWKNKSDKRWFWLGFQALQKSGLTYYETDEEEMEVREKVVLMCIFYYEFCNISAFHESENFVYWDATLITQLKNDFSKYADIEMINVRDALVEYFGNEDETTAELWINCVEGSSNHSLKLLDRVMSYEEIIVNKKKDGLYTQSLDWLSYPSIELKGFEGISI